MARDAAGGTERNGLVIAGHGAQVVVEDEFGKRFRCAVRRRGVRPVAGDRVRWQATGKRHGVVARVLERRNLLARPTDRGQSKPMAANLDRIVVVVAPRPAFSEALLDRYLVVAETLNIPVTILLNKVDLLDDTAREAFERRLETYEAIGYPLIRASTRQLQGLEALKNHLAGQTAILVGQSGVGKSSLIRGLLPEQVISVGALHEGTGQGRHTTTATTLYPLPGGGHIIDSPGVRDFGLWHISPERLADGFLEFRPYVGHCRFRNCRHLDDPGCAIRKAVEDGRISPARYTGFRGMLEDRTGTA